MNRRFGVFTTEKILKVKYLNFIIICFDFLKKNTKVLTSRGELMEFIVSRFY